MSEATQVNDSALSFGTAALRLPAGIRGPLREHLARLKAYYLGLGWGEKVGFGDRPALLVIDLALFWTRPEWQMGSEVDSVVEATVRVLEAARAAKIPVFFTTNDYDPDDPPSPHSRKLKFRVPKGRTEEVFSLDPRLGRRPGEKIVKKKYASAFKATPLFEMLSGLCVDTLIVTGLSTSHCVYATCRDATDSFRVIVPREGVGERCEIMHEVNLLDIDIDLGDVLPEAAVIEYLSRRAGNRAD